MNRANVGLLGWCGLWKCALLVVFLPPLCCCGCSRTVGTWEGNHVGLDIVLLGREETELEPNNADCAPKLNSEHHWFIDCPLSGAITVS
jgi:hypothetical protein